MTARYSSLIMPLGSGFVTTGSSLQCVAENPTRRGLWFHNPNPTGNVYVAPAPIAAVVGGAGSILLFPGDWLMFDELAASCAWNCIGPGNLTILDWPAL